MKNKDTQMDELLRQYLCNEKREMAPEGFTERLMSRVRMEPARLTRGRNRVPVITSFVIAGFLLAAVLTPGKWISLPEISLFKNFDLPFSNKLAEMQLPGILLYVISGVIFLTVVDGILSGVIFKKKN